MVAALDGNFALAQAMALDTAAGSAAANAALHQSAVDALVSFNEESAETMNVTSAATVGISISLMILLTIIGLAMSVFMGIWLGVFATSRPLMKLSATLRSGAIQISSASSQLSESAQDLANGATEQASGIEETSSSMEELASMVKQNLANSREESLLAEKASSASQEGNQDIVKMVESMNEIAKSSEEVGNVIKLIEDISFQTNILALNAAVEAARAGEAGMGFAVVADEVKNLANRSAEAAKDTARMIEDSIHKSADGLKLAQRVAEAFKGILANSNKLAEMSKEVESASVQQDTGINQVTKAMIQFDTVVQANASSAEESASSAEELAGQAASLMKIVSDLTKLVMGKEDTNDREAATYQIHHQTPSAARPAAPKPARLTPQTAAPRIKEIDPEKLIPFEDDEELKHS